MALRLTRQVVLVVALALCACGPATVAPEPDAGTHIIDGGSLEDDGGTTLPDGGASVVAYPVGRTHSPVTTEVAAHLRAIAALKPSRAGSVFSKVGDSNTVNPNHLHCFAGTQVDLGLHGALEPALAHFRAGQVDGGTPFSRTSLAAQVGWSAGAALAGAPSPLQQELDAANPRFASVMFGTNDVGAADPYAFGRNLLALVDLLSLQGVVPVVSSAPPRTDNATATAWVQRYNLVARGVAQLRRVPFVDVHRELDALPARGLGGDGVHLNVYATTTARGCLLTGSALDFGHNRRNLLTLAALDRAWSAVEGRPPPDDDVPRRPGRGVLGDPVVIDALPFVDARDTRVDGAARLDAYPGCQSAANEGGREVLYRLDLAQPAQVRAFVVAVGGADVDVHVLSSPESGQACVQRHDRLVVRQLAAGTHWLALDTYVADGAPLAGEYVLVVMAE